MSIDKVAADNFYKDRGDQIKQNWFLYEYANILFSKIEDNPALSSYRKKHSESNIVEFCVYFSKRLRKSVSDLQRKLASSVIIDARYIYEFYPGNPRTQTQRLLEAAGAAWDEHLIACSNCPNQCLPEGYEPTGMFDCLEKTGWPTL